MLGNNKISTGIALTLLLLNPWFARQGGAQCESAVLTGSTGFGGYANTPALSIDGETIAVGAGTQDVSGTSNAGRVFLYRDNGAGWVETTLTRLSPVQNDNFGAAVAVSGNRLAVGVPNSDEVNPGSSSCDSGSVHTYEFDGTTWIDTGVVVPHPSSCSSMWNPPCCNTHLGKAVALDGELLVSGANRSGGGGDFRGRVYIHRYDGATWNAEAVLGSPGGELQDTYGTTVAVSGNTVVVGDWQYGGTNTGAVLVYEQDHQGVWTLVANFQGANNQQMGRNVEIHGDLIVSNYGSGGARIFRRTAAGWSFEQEIQPGVGSVVSVEVAPDTVFLGCPFYDFPGASDAGATLVYRYMNGAWNQTDILGPSTPAGSRQSGFSLAVSGTTVVAGSLNFSQVHVLSMNGSGVPSCDLQMTPSVTGLSCSSTAAQATLSWSNAAPYDAVEVSRDGLVIALLSGSANSFVDNVLTLGPSDYQVVALQNGVRSTSQNCRVSPPFDLGQIVSSSPTADARFGIVAVDGDVAVVGSSAPGNPAQVFRRSGSQWNQEATLASGGAVAVEGDVVVVGNTSYDIPLNNCGTAYAYRWNGSAWIQEAQFSAQSPIASGWFGRAVAVSAGRIAIGDRRDATDPGSVTTFEYDSGSGQWNFDQLLISGTPSFGVRVAMDGNRLLVSDPGDDVLATNSGAVHSYTHSAGSWGSPQILRPTTNFYAHLSFGDSLSVHADLAIVGGGSGLPGDPGQAYIFRDNGGQLQLEDTIVGPTGEGFAASVAIDGDRAVIGATGNISLPGTAREYCHASGNWILARTLQSPNAVPLDAFGQSVALKSDLLVVGAILDDAAGPNDAGAAYAFDLSGPDCNGNGVPDACDIAVGTSADTNSNGIPDGCETNLTITALTCTQTPGSSTSVDLQWSNSTTFDSIDVFTDGVLVTSIASSTSTATVEVSQGYRQLAVVGHLGSDSTAPAYCWFLLTGPFNEAVATDLDQGETAIVVTGDGTPDPVANPMAVVQNSMGLDNQTVRMISHPGPPTPGPGALSVLGIALDVTTSLPDGSYFMQLSVPFTQADLTTAGVSDPLTVDLLYFDVVGNAWRLAAEGNVGLNPQTQQAVGNRFSVSGTTPPILSADLGDYGVFWNPTTQTGFVWANVDHTTEYAAGLVSSAPEFQRGDCNADGGYDLADAITMLGYSFSGGSVDCLVACDANDDDLVNIADPIFTLAYLFSAGPPPPGPFGVCGTDPTPGILDCAAYNTCP